MYSCSDSALLLFDKYEGKVGIAAGRSRGGGAAEVRGQQSHLLGMGAHHVVSQINVAAYSLAAGGRLVHCWDWPSSVETAVSPLCRDGHWTAAPRLLARAFLGFSRCAQHVAPPMSHASGTRRFETCHPRAAYSCMAVHASGRHPSRTSDYCLARGPRA